MILKTQEKKINILQYWFKYIFISLCLRITKHFGKQSICLLFKHRVPVPRNLHHNPDVLVSHLSENLSKRNEMKTQRKRLVYNRFSPEQMPCKDSFIKSKQKILFIFLLQLKISIQLLISNQ